MTRHQTNTPSISHLLRCMGLGFTALGYAAIPQTSQAGTQVIANGIPMAENALVLNENTLFVSSKQGIYQLKKIQGTWHKTLLTTYLRDGTTTTSCQMGGMTRAKTHANDTAKNTLAYAVCSEGFGNPSATSRLMMFNPNASEPKVTEVDTINVTAPNGMAADNEGNLYVADTGGFFSFGGALVKIKLNPFTAITPSNTQNTQVAHGVPKYIQATPTVTLKQSTYQGFLFQRPNGVRFQGNRLYLSLIPAAFVVGRSRINSYRLAPLGLSDKREHASSYAFLDDFSFSSQGLVTTAFVGQRVALRDTTGTPIASEFVWLPTSIHRYPYPPTDAHSNRFVVTSQTGTVSLVDFKR